MHTLPIARLLGSFAAALLLGALPAQANYAWTFNDGWLPHWTQQGVALANCSGLPEYQLFQAAGGVLQQRTAAAPVCGAYFYGGTLPNGAPVTTAGLRPWLPTFAEARFAVQAGAGIGSAGTPILWLIAGGRTALLVDFAAGRVGVEHAGGVAWSLPAGLAAMRTYRLVVDPNSGVPAVSLSIDGTLQIGPLPATADWLNDGWAFGDIAAANQSGIDIDWDYVSIVQHPPGYGQANTADAMLFVGSGPGSTAAPGLPGPFQFVGLGYQNLTLAWNGPSGAPFALLVAPTLGPPRPLGCGGSLDIGTAPGFADIAVAFDPTVPIFGALFTLSASGYAYQNLQVPPMPPGLLLGAIQGVVFQPAGCGYRTTAAHELRY